RRHTRFKCDWSSDVCSSDLVEFRDAEPGRVAYLAGRRWPVWMIEELVEEHRGRVTAAAKQMRRPVALVRMALAYAERYPDEIARSEERRVGKACSDGRRAYH